MNRLFLPLAEAYLRRSENPQNAAPISHTDPAMVDPAVLESLATVCNRLRGVGYYNLRQEMRLKHDAERFDEIIREVFDELMFDFCERIAALDVDVVLLAGQPSKLQSLREIIKRHLPLTDSRIISMHHRYAGNWYPYQDADGGAPGRIVDPKSTVVVGAAIRFLARNGSLPQFRFETRDVEHQVSYYWGAMVDAGRQLRPERILFQPVGAESNRDTIEFQTISQRLLIGRAGQDSSRRQPTPAYQLTLEADGRVGPSEVSVRLRRIRATREVEEHLAVESVSGTVAGEPAELDRNVFFRWHTLVDDRFFLDTGGLDHIEWEGSLC